MSNAVVKVEGICAVFAQCPVTRNCSVHGKLFSGGGDTPENAARAQGAYRLKLNYDARKKEYLAVQCRKKGNVSFTVIH